MKTFFRVLLALVLLVLILALRTLYLAGSFKSLKPHKPAEEISISGMMGVEDITIDPATGMALASSNDRRRVRANEPSTGAIFQFDAASPTPAFIDLTAGLNLPEFHPHGISLFTDPSDGSKWVFAVNHRKGASCIEIFQYTDTMLVHSATIQSPEFKSPNDVVGVGKRTFYFTNDHDRHPDGGFSSLKDFLVIGTGQVGFFDGEKATLLDKGIRYANGITASPDAKFLYMAACTDGAIYVYQREPFQKIREIECGTGVDNLEWDAEGNLWAGAHPKMLAFLGHAQKAEKRSPSQVLKINLQNPKNPIVDEIYLNNGNPLSGSSVAAVYHNRLFIGSVFEDGIVILEIGK
ncbi:MAG: SMP-30/gluconolactonase/LRE family protein [Haliscomenobacter sp.]|nr:SMP-30/gluconolactonase/LRE family protein [Haliscomenobacter sp.]